MKGSCLRFRQPRDRSRAVAGEFRFGGLYVSLGGIQIGVNSENVRHAIQNVFAHDIMYSLIRGNKLPHFAIDRSKNPTRFYWNIGTGTGNTLW